MEDFKHKGPEHTEKFKAGRHRTYFFDVYSTRKGEYYLTVTESKKRADGKGYERHKIFLYKEDLNRFLEMLQQSINHVKEVMPEYDYDEFARRQIEWESQRDSNKLKEGVYDGDANEMEEADKLEETATPAPLYNTTVYDADGSGINHKHDDIDDDNEAYAVQPVHFQKPEPAQEDHSANIAPDPHAHEDLSW